MAPLTPIEDSAVRQFLRAFNLDERASADAVGNALFNQKQLNDFQGAKNYVDQFFIKCSQRDPHGTKPLQKRATAIMNQSDNMILMMDFLVRCRQSHLFYEKVSGNESISGRTPSSASSQSSPFQRRAASRTRVHTTLTGDPVQSITPLANESTRSRANSSFTSYESRIGHSQNLGMERSGGRPKSPFRILNAANNKSLTSTPLSASNHLFSSNGYGNNTPSSFSQSYRAQESPSPLQQRNPSNSTTSTIRSQNLLSSTPIHARIGSALCETEGIVCESLLSALLGIDSRLFRSDGARKMNISSTASLTTTHLILSNRVLNVANTYTHLSQKEAFGAKESPISEALLASIRYVLGDYTADIDLLRRKKNLTFARILPVVDQWNSRLTVLAMCYKLRKMKQLDILDCLYVIHCDFRYDPIRKPVLDKVLDYTMGVFCKQMVEWMTTGECPTEKWVIEKDPQTKMMGIRRIPVFLSDYEARILLEIGKALPRVDSTSDEDLAAIDQATSIVSNGLTPKVIFNKELAPLLRILRDVVCGIVMRTVLTTGRLKEHLQKASSFFFLADPRFTYMLYTVIKEASMGLRVGSNSLNTQQVRSALAAAIGSSAFNSNETNNKNSKKKKLMFVLDSMTSLGNTPNVSSRMQFVQPLRPKYEPTMDLMKPIFDPCDSYYEAIFHVIWAIDLARLSSQEATSLIPTMLRFLELNYSLRENAWSLIQMISHIFYVINSTLTKVRNTVTIQTNLQFSKLLAAVDEKCVDVDDVIDEHLKFVKRVSVVVYLNDNEVIEQQLSLFLQTAFEAQEMVGEFNQTWEEMIELAAGDMNVLKAKMAENCKKRVVGIRVLLDKINTVQKKLMDELDHQIIFGNDALID